MTRLRRRRLDLTSLGGLPVGIGLVLLGHGVADGAFQSVVQLTAGVIVLGGTLGAVLVSFSLDQFWHAARSLKTVFVNDEPSSAKLISVIVSFARKARRNGLGAIDEELEELDEPFLAKGLRLIVDSHPPEAVRDLLEVADRSRTARDASAARVYESAGGYAPTFGILGAVLGLIQVMEHLTDPSRLGAGIAVAFVATAYGVGVANLVFLPIATKLRMRARRAADRRELMIEGIMAIHAGTSPQFIQAKLAGFLEEGAETPEVQRPALRRAA